MRRSVEIGADLSRHKKVLSNTETRERAAIRLGSTQAHNAEFKSTLREQKAQLKM